MLYRAVVTGDWKRAHVRSVSVVGGFRRLCAVAGAGLLAVWAMSCGGGEKREAKVGLKKAGLTPPACHQDEVREFRCDALLPRTSALPAPEPYETCPSAIDVRDAVFPPRTGSGRFDARRTER